MRWNTSRRYSNGSMSRRLHVAVMFVTIAAVRPPLSLPRKVQLRLPTAIPRRLRLPPLLSISRLPSSQYRTSPSQFDHIYDMAVPSGLSGNTVGCSRSR